MNALVELLERKGVPYKLGGEHRHVRPGWVGIDCRVCSPGAAKYKLGIALDGGACSCWTCGGMWAVREVALACRVDYREAEAVLRASVGLWRPVASDRGEGRLKLPAGLGKLLGPHRDYLAGRGIDPDYAEEVWGAQGIGVNARLAWRVWLPVTKDKKIVSWTTRTIRPDEEPRYQRAGADEEEVGPGECLFGLDFVYHTVIVFEGPLDVLRVGPGCVALQGLRWSPWHVRTLGRVPVRYICLDNEPLATLRAFRLVNELKAFPGKTVRLRLESGKDAGEAEGWELRELRGLLK